jgi:hypothetical protein
MIRIIEIQALENGSHRNQTGELLAIPEGWAVIPDDMETPNFPFGEIEVEEIDGVMTVVKWVAGTLPEVEEPEPLSKVEQLIETLYKAGKLTEEEYRAITNGDTA